MTTTQQAVSWARREFRSALLGDKRRTDRLISMASRTAIAPGGTISGVFSDGAERQGAYDFVRNDSIRPTALIASTSQATARRCCAEDFSYVAVDGSSLTLTDRSKTKDFGNIGSSKKGARGLKVINAYAISPDGVSLGLVDQQWWKRAKHKKRRDHRRRPLAERETKHWVNAIRTGAERLKRAGARAWFLVDREGDGYHILKTLNETKEYFTVRSAHSNRIVEHKGKRMSLAKALRRTNVAFQCFIHVPRGPKRRARRAHMRVRCTTVTLHMVEAFTKETYSMTVNVVDVREYASTAKGDTPIHWRLLTNQSVAAKENINLVVSAYGLRWRVEDFHRTWKSGACDAEKSQLRSADNVIRWAVILAATAARIERLKGLSRLDEDLPAEQEFSKQEIRAILLLHEAFCGKTHSSTEPLTVRKLVYWVAEIGGYTGKSSGGPPGAKTIKRGFDRVAPVAVVVDKFTESKNFR